MLELVLVNIFGFIISLLTRGNSGWWKAWGDVLVGGGVLGEEVVLGRGEVPGVLGGRGFLKGGEVVRLGVGFGFKIVDLSIF